MNDSKVHTALAVAKRCIDIQVGLADSICRVLPGMKVYVYDDCRWFEGALPMTTTSGIRYLYKDSRIAVLSSAAQLAIGPEGWEHYASLTPRTFLRDDIGLFIQAPGLLTDD